MFQCRYLTHIYLPCKEEPSTSARRPYPAVESIPGLLVFHNVSSDQLLHDFIGPPVDGLYSGICIRLGNISFPHETPATMQLQAVCSNLVLQNSLTVGNRVHSNNQSLLWQLFHELVKPGVL